MDGSENKIRIEADRQHVVEALTDPTIYPLWLVGSQGIRAVDDDGPPRTPSSTTGLVL